LDSYLQLAEEVLRAARRPLTAQQILKRAYLDNIVPTQLHGKTQHKTLGARLSEDILLRRERSAFFRTAPGRFFLSTYLSDPGIPEKFRVPMIARRRRRELLQGRPLAIKREGLPRCSHDVCPPSAILNPLTSRYLHYLSDLADKNVSDYTIWAFVMVTKGRDVLTYRQGRYREDRDAFLLKRSVGFFTPVIDIDCDLFHDGDHGIVASGLKAVIMDLDLPSRSQNTSEYEEETNIECFIRVDNQDKSDLLALVRFECPNWFEPLGRRLAINDLSWMDLLRPVNHLADFDPWSQRVLNWAQSASEK